ncbi:MAG TPA: plastocyanin/azurin family copper-binding protein [Candidatus Limnocylindria bacterium]|nr:plastocyanin/azurin family copper-binding protein [Candidatus Limnocylindria bacterium]
MTTDLPLRRPARLAWMLPALLVLAACSGATSTTPSPTAAASSAAASASAQGESPVAGIDADVTVTLSGFAFTGDEVDDSGAVPTLTIPPGTTVAFVNEDSAPHTATHGTNGSAAADAAFDLSLGATGASATHTFDTAGEFQVTCRFHSGMNVTIVVE